MIRRTAEVKLLNLAAVWKAVAVTGPRQSGKTTLLRNLFGDRPYVSLEEPDIRQFALEDPRGFLASYPDGAVFDEIQRTPELFSYLQRILDESRVPGRYVLSGSNNFLLQQNISQTLAGRVAYLTLLPFALEELFPRDGLPGLDALMLSGLYPPVYDQGIPAHDWASNYIRTYVERDVRQIKNISDLLVFERFLRLLAGRNGQELNFSALAVEAGIDVKTAQGWVGVLESSYIIFLLRPFHRNFNKTVVKRPKLYFYDTALVCSLLGIKDRAQLAYHPLRGPLFESLVVADLVKQRLHRGLDVNLSYWREKSGREVDLIIEKAEGFLPVEIKAGMTSQSSFFDSVQAWSALAASLPGRVIYAGDRSEIRSDGKELVSWKSFADPSQVSRLL